jgi:ABC-2 type transport system permease protein
MNKILALAITNIRLVFSERLTWFVTFIMPILFTAILASAIGGGDDGGDNRAPILVINEDGGALAAQLESALAASTVLRPAEAADEQPLPTTRADALERLDDYTRVLVLPTGFSEAVASGEAIEAELHLAEDADLQRTRAVQQELDALFTTLGASVQSARTATEQAEEVRPFASEAERQSYFDTALERAQSLQADAPITLVREQATRAEEGVALGAAQSSPGQLVTFALITLMGISTALVYERTVGTLRRLMSAPISKLSILIGKMLGYYLVGIVQMTLLIVVGQVVFGVNWGRSPLALVLVILSFGLAAVSIGLFIATLARTSEQANQMATATAMLIAAVGGAWWPLEIVGEPLRSVAYLLPTAWAMDGLQGIILRGADASSVLLNVAVLLGFAALFLTLGVRRLRFE